MWLSLPFVADLCCAAEHLHYAVRAPDDAPVDGLPFAMFACAALTPAPSVLLSPTSAAPEWPPAREGCAFFGVAVVTMLDYFLSAFLIARATSQVAYVVTLAGIGWGMLLFAESHSTGIWIALVLALTGVFPVQPGKARP